MSQLPPFALLVTHTSNDVDHWKSAFDSNQAARKAASILGHHINLGAENLVAVYMPATDRAKVQAFLASPELREAMKAAGMTSPPRIDWLKPILDGHIGDRATAAMIVTHEVADFDAWKAVYDSMASKRRERGIIGAAVNQALDNPNLVTVYHQAETRAELEAFVASIDLKVAMQAAGVKGPPEIRFVRSLPGVAY